MNDWRRRDLDRLRIDRCVCHRVTFAALKETAAAHGCTRLKQLLDVADFGRTCMMCHRYVRVMLKTGQTVFHETLPPARESPADPDG